MLLERETHRCLSALPLFTLRIACCTPSYSCLQCSPGRYCVGPLPLEHGKGRGRCHIGVANHRGQPPSPGPRRRMPMNQILHDSPSPLMDKTDSPARWCRHKEQRHGAPLRPERAGRSIEYARSFFLFAFVAPPPFEWRSYAGNCQLQVLICSPRATP